jgi:two-component system response regulator RegA
MLFKVNAMSEPATIINESKGRLVIVDDDQVLGDRLGKALERRGYEITVINTVSEALEWIEDTAPDFALIDLRLTDGNGVDVVQKIKETCPECRTVMMTAYGNIATAVSAVKAGAVDYLTKPADADAVETVLMGDSASRPVIPTRPMSAERVRWEHIQRIYEQCDRNVSETARRLSMHRRTLQRILAKYAPRENTQD